jgi:four helix bundle protein
MGDYKKLEVWRLSCEFADRVDRMVSTLPDRIRQRALDQLVPAAHAIHENLAEGCGFDSDTQLLKYTRQALATANESEDELLELDRKELLGDYAGLLDEIRRVCAMLAGLKRKLETDLAGRRRPSAARRRRQPIADSRASKPNAGADSRERVPEAKRQEPS